ncbi:hypothetical protein [Streptomyces sp. S.PNR 29]|uniref:hypothetical protein n=1 Tax=Streptomyces sp. S.PNR 29 TaxID=2973805 RepID=UPI0025B0280F|nr:hypothetical protein [Streptomyces sp. S.PNR 29]MDN0198066.1 hypothetical protein [Streptomyces sp. S.PNR 29]
MTSKARIAAAAVGLVGALALSACSDGGGSGDSTDKASATPGASADTGGGSGGSSSTAADGLQGNWLATTGGKAVALIVTGKEAGLFTTAGTVCSGTAGEEAGMRMIHLKCSGQDKDRTTGMVDSVGKKTLKVSWEGGLGEETYTRSEGGKLPTGLPTAGLGS